MEAKSGSGAGHLTPSQNCHFYISLLPDRIREREKRGFLPHTSIRRATASKQQLYTESKKEIANFGRLFRASGLSLGLGLMDFPFSAD